MLPRSYSGYTGRPVVLDSLPAAIGRPASVQHQAQPPYDQLRSRRLNPPKQSDLPTGASHLHGTGRGAASGLELLAAQAGQAQAEAQEGSAAPGHAGQF